MPLDVVPYSAAPTSVQWSPYGQAYSQTRAPTDYLYNTSTVPTCWSESGETSEDTLDYISKVVGGDHEGPGRNGTRFAALQCTPTVTETRDAMSETTQGTVDPGLTSAGGLPSYYQYLSGIHGSPPPADTVEGGTTETTTLDVDMPSTTIMTVSDGYTDTLPLSSPSPARPQPIPRAASPTDYPSPPPTHHDSSQGSSDNTNQTGSFYSWMPGAGLIALATAPLAYAGNQLNQASENLLNLNTKFFDHVLSTGKEFISETTKSVSSTIGAASAQAHDYFTSAPSRVASRFWSGVEELHRRGAYTVEEPDVFGLYTCPDSYIRPGKRPDGLSSIESHCRRVVEERSGLAGAPSRDEATFVTNGRNG